MKIEVGEKLFEFSSKHDWVNNAAYLFEMHGLRGNHTLCIDQQGRICAWGEHFMQAEKDNAYPIEVFKLRKDLRFGMRAAELAKLEETEAGNV